MSENQTKFLTTVAQAIYDKKGMNILAIDVRGISSLTDYVLIAEGSVDRHVTAIAHAVIDALKKVGERPFQVEGITLDELLCGFQGAENAHVAPVRKRPDADHHAPTHELFHQDLVPGIHRHDAFHGGSCPDADHDVLHGLYFSRYLRKSLLWHRQPDALPITMPTTRILPTMC